MPLPNPGMTFTPFDPLPASDLNKIVENIEALSDGTGIDDLSLAVTDIANPYRFSVYRSGAWTSATGVYGLVTFDTEVFDNNNNYNPATGKYVAPKTGFYDIVAAVNAGVSSPNAYAVGIYVNGVQRQLGTNQYAYVSNTQSAQVVAIGLELNANDEVQIFFAGSGGGGNTGRVSTYFQGAFRNNT